MRIFKFGGASVKDAKGVKNVERVLNYTGHDGVLIVISAMGKTTNALEDVLKSYFNKEDYISRIEEIKAYHLDIAKELMPKNTDIQNLISEQFDGLNQFLNKNKSHNYDFVYDQVVSNGELISTKIVSAYLNTKEIPSVWVDARDYIKTNNTYREGKVNWEASLENIKTLEKDKLYVTQGFIGSDENYLTTTLGREGSDYTGAIIAYCLNAKSLTIWKDVPGVLNADPRYFKDTTLLCQIPYEEAIELAYYGASVIHPKTLQPLQKKGIPLYVKCFENPEGKGTVIQEGNGLEPKTPCFIIKKNQKVLEISTLSFDFIDENVIKDVFHKLSENQLKVNLIQISAISLYLCIEDKFNKLTKAVETFRKDFNVELTDGCSLYTIRHYNAKSKELIPDTENALIKQSSKNTLQLVMKDEV